MPFLLVIMRRVFGLKYEEGIGKQIGKSRFLAVFRYGL